MRTRTRSTPWGAAALVAAVLLGSAPSPAAGQVLEYGPWSSGFRVIEAYDSTRSFRPKRDAAGRPAGETARPIQVSLWYPARRAADAEPMRGGDFRLLIESELTSTPPSPDEARRLRQEFIDAVVGFGTPPARAAALWDDEVPVFRDLHPVPGPHPTVVYFTSAGVSNPLLPAYLASHGFVVASFPSNGRMTEVALEFTPNALTLDTDIDDAGFVHGILRRNPLVDASRLSVLAFSGGSLAALIWQMRDMQADAFVSVEGWERYRRGADILAESLHYDPARLRVPTLMIERAPPETSPAYAKVGDVVDSLRYADLRRVAFRDAAHGDFLSHASGGHTEDQARIWATSAHMVRLFLQARLLGDEAAADSLVELRPSPDDPFFTTSRRAALPAAPTEEELFRMAELDPAAMARAWRAAAAREPGRPLFREHVLTRAAVFAPTVADRLVLLEVIAEAHPRSVAARWRLGTTLREAGREDEAVRTLREALSSLADDPSLDAAAREEWRERLRTALEGGG